MDSSFSSYLMHNTRYLSVMEKWKKMILDFDLASGHTDKSSVMYKIK